MIKSSILKSPIYAELERHDTGWVACSDWTQSKFGDTFGNDVVHNFDTPLSHLLVTFLLSPTGADNDCFIIHTALGTVVSEQTGLSLVGVDNDSLYFRSGLNGIRYTHPSGALFLLSTQSWYYKIVVTKPQGVVSIRNISEDISTTAVDTGKNDSDGKRIYRREWTGTTGAGVSSTLALGLTVYRRTKPIDFQINSSSYGWMGTEGAVVILAYFTNTTQNDITLYHNAAHLQSRPYRLIMGYTV